MIIAACGTVSSTVGDSEFGGVMQSGNGVLYTGVIHPAVNAAISSTKNGRIGIIGTSATIRSGSYKNLIKSIMPKAEVFEKACPMFVPLVENGRVNRGDVVIETVAADLWSHLSRPVWTLLFWDAPTTPCSRTLSLR